MNYRLGKIEDLDEIERLIKDAISLMREQGIEQWDEVYPAREDFAKDIEQGYLYVADKEDKMAAIYVISEECDAAYMNGQWENEKPCIIHRLCVSADCQNEGIGKKVLKHIENQLVDMGYDSVRLDVFSENPYALKLYDKNGYTKRGYADWRKGRFYLMEKSI